MGGYGAWLLAAFEPDRYAAVATMSRGGDLEDVRKLVGTLVWAFHEKKQPSNSGRDRQSLIV